MLEAVPFDFWATQQCCLIDQSHTKCHILFGNEAQGRAGWWTPHARRCCCMPSEEASRSPWYHEQSSHSPLIDSVDEVRTSELWWCYWWDVLLINLISFFFPSTVLVLSRAGMRKALVEADVWAMPETAGLCLGSFALYVSRSNKDLPE